MIAVLIYIYITICITAPFDPTPNGGDFGVGGSLGESEVEEDEEDQGVVAGIVIGSVFGFIILLALISIALNCCVYLLSRNEDNGYVNTIAYRIAGKFDGGKVWQIDSFWAFGERKFGELIDQPIGY